MEKANELEITDAISKLIAEGLTGIMTLTAMAKSYLTGKQLPTIAGPLLRLLD